MDYDVAIVGGGPGGSTTGALLRKYDPALKVLILERERFPREHVGESQLPPIGRVLSEMGVWEKVEAAGFPIKLGATFTWGTTTEPWVFGFIPVEEVGVEGRPGAYAGWRERVAFQVDRARYDELLLDHAADLGCEVRQEARVTEVLAEGDTIRGLRLASGETITARRYVDASGNAAVLRRAMGVAVDAPTLLRNVAFWDYWEAPGLNAPILERGATRVLVRSVPFGWLWYIALSEDRTSVGLVCPAAYAKSAGRRPEALYAEALALEPSLSGLLSRATSRQRLDTTTDWSFVAERTFGDNWFLCGEALGFADPILAAGMTLTQTCARHCAYTLLELDRGRHDPAWLCAQYDGTQRRRVLQHIRFAEYWYSANGCFNDLQEYCAEIASHAGLKLNPTDAFRWLSTGGLDDELGQVAIGGLDLAGVKQVQWRLHSGKENVTYAIDGKNRFTLDLDGAESATVAQLADGEIRAIPAYTRDGHVLALAGGFGLVFAALLESPRADRLVQHIQTAFQARGIPAAERPLVFAQVIQCLELMANQGWVRCRVKEKEPKLELKTPREGRLIYSDKPPRSG